MSAPDGPRCCDVPATADAPSTWPAGGVLARFTSSAKSRPRGRKLCTAPVLPDRVSVHTTSEGITRGENGGTAHRGGHG
jgi:hypothetical protein